MAWTKAAHTFRHECDIQRTPQQSLFEGGHQRNTIRSPAVSPAIPIPINNHDQTHPKNIKKRDSFSEMNDPTRYFSKERDLAKRCNRWNRTSRSNICICIYVYSFPFSIVLVYVYAHKSGSMYKSTAIFHCTFIAPNEDCRSEQNSTKQKNKSFYLIHPVNLNVVVWSLHDKYNQESITKWLVATCAIIGREVKAS